MAEEREALRGRRIIGAWPQVNVSTAGDSLVSRWQIKGHRSFVQHGGLKIHGRNVRRQRAFLVSG